MLVGRKFLVERVDVVLVAIIKDTQERHDQLLLWWDLLCNVDRGSGPNFDGDNRAVDNAIIISLFKIF